MVFSRFTAGKEGTLWYYQGLSAIFNRRLPGVLADELARTIQAVTGDNVDIAYVDQGYTGARAA